MKKVLITGGSGFIAQNLINYLRVKNYDAWFISRSLSNDPKSFQVDFTEYFKLKEKLKNTDFDAIIHCAAHIPEPENKLDKELCQKVNFNGAYNLLEHAVANNIKSFIYLSSLSVYNGSKSDFISEKSILCPESDYALSKASAEFLCRLYNKKYNLKTLILRIGTVYGLGMKKNRMINYFIEKCFNNEDIEVYDSNLVINTVYIKDVVRVIEKLIGCDYDEYNLAIDNITKEKIVKTIAKCLNSKSSLSFKPGKKSNLKNISISKIRKKIYEKDLIFFSFEEGIKDMIKNNGSTKWKK